MSEALRALFEGDITRAHESLGPDDTLTVFDAAAFGRVERLVELITADPAVDSAVSADGFSALHLAIFGGQAESVRVLIAAGADVDRRSSGPIAEVPPLGTAAFVRSVALAKLLLDAGADVNGRAAGGFTALHTAAQNEDIDLARELLARGADPTSRSADGRTASDLASGAELLALLARHEL
ncbi:MAG TPA: ankyrin repeat domain-containing protein [Solirubrobacteraceae bacterium]|jgi:ankyrin repeat protein|nr:ankyrin repeat domain-containing protein [Solirubrobacteraceae bacterium]